MGKIPYVQIVTDNQVEVHHRFEQHLLNGENISDCYFVSPSNHSIKLIFI